LPQIVVVDGGPEFGSVYFETFLARYEITKKTRPIAQPRHGSVCERLLGTTTSQFIHNLRGNTQITKLVRQVTKSVDPRQHACWTLGMLYVYLCVYAYEIYDTLEHPALGRSPRDAYAAGMTLGGERLHRLIPYDEQFRMMTLPSTAKGTAVVHPSRGVKINSVYYWHDAFRDPTLTGQSVPVRFDPFDIGSAYVYVRNQWIRCHSEHYAILHGHSEREKQLITQRLHERARSHGQSCTVTARQLATFFASVEAQEEILAQRVRDAEARQALTLVQQGAQRGRHLGAEGQHHGRLEVADAHEHQTEPADAGLAKETAAMDRDAAGRDAGKAQTAAERAAADRRRLRPYGSFL
jgi:hypothetical protein